MCIGDSHASTIYGKTWPDFVSKELNLNLVRASSPGAGNSFYIEKLHYCIKNYDLDLIIVQLTEPSRIVLGFDNISNEVYRPDFLNDGSVFNNLKCYTWNGYSNESNLKRLSKKNINIDDLWIEHISTSKWVDYKILQDIALMYFLCKNFNINLIFWSWFMDFEVLFSEEYKWLKNKINYIPGFGYQILEKGNQKPIPGDGHYTDEPHKFLTETWLLPEINKIRKEWHRT